MRRTKRPVRHAGVVWQVRVKVTEVRDDGGGPPKVNCSMRAVDQETGEDLDPGGALLRGGGRPIGGGGAPRGPVSDAPPEVCADYHAWHNIAPAWVQHALHDSVQCDLGLWDVSTARSKFACSSLRSECMGYVVQQHELPHASMWMFSLYN